MLSLKTREIERKFLVQRIPRNLHTTPHQEIIQGYLVLMDDGMEIRLRQKGNTCYQTVKSGNGLTRGELEIELTREQFETLWPLTEGSRIEKVRYEIEYQDLTIELDVYGGSLKDLVIAEVEFTSEENSRAFSPPQWFGPEVTEDLRYKNAKLALSGIPLST